MVRLQHMAVNHLVHRDARNQRFGHDPPFALSDQCRLAAEAARSCTNPTASIWRTRWAPTDTTRANLHTGPHCNSWIHQEGGGLPPLPELHDTRSIVMSLVRHPQTMTKLCDRTVSATLSWPSHGCQPAMPRDSLSLDKQGGLKPREKSAADAVARHHPVGQFRAGPRHHRLSVQGMAIGQPAALTTRQ